MYGLSEPWFVVQVIPEYPDLKVVFADGTAKAFDTTELTGEGGAFAVLRDREFSNVSALSTERSPGQISSTWTGTSIGKPSVRNVVRPERGHFCGGSSRARASLINSSRCSGSVGDGSKSKCA